MQPRNYHGKTFKNNQAEAAEAANCSKAGSEGRALIADGEATVLVEPLTVPQKVAWLCKEAHDALKKYVGALEEKRKKQGYQAAAATAACQAARVNLVAARAEVRQSSAGFEDLKKLQEHFDAAEAAGLASLIPQTVRTQLQQIVSQVSEVARALAIRVAKVWTQSLDEAIGAEAGALPSTASGVHSSVSQVPTLGSSSSPGSIPVGLPGAVPSSVPTSALDMALNYLFASLRSRSGCRASRRHGMPDRPTSSKASSPGPVVP
ncbi:hypothetical protein cyc_06945 [Cyclospora cayetanensis]|uniref:Uncharacterized protein n=1 Tax=Cyclospora cayetanensis TaxID=88456 RepID=A0A1D3D014_9EIME|nr:hypothetical protein cyc_06945 [Cyclospora cayetanensis]